MHIRERHPSVFDESRKDRTAEVFQFLKGGLPLIVLSSVAIGWLISSLIPTQKYAIPLAFFGASDVFIAGTTAYLHKRGLLDKSILEGTVGSGLERYLLEDCIICGQLIPVSEFALHLSRIHESEARCYRVAKLALNSFLLLSTMILWIGLQCLFVFDEVEWLESLVIVMVLSMVLFSGVFISFLLMIHRRWTRLRNQQSRNPL
jgi:hypothetical protein